jgi:hypothetical protein
MTTHIEDAEEWASVLNENMMCFDEKQDKDVELPENPTLDQLKSALEITRVQANLALIPIIQEIRAMQKELDKLRNHRHDFSKTFSGRAEV